VGDLPTMSDTDRALVEAWNRSHDGALPGDETVDALIAEQAQRTPAATAVVHRGRQWTYAELDERADRVAAHLRELGVGRDDLVGVFVDRSPEMVAALVGIMRAGAAYVPMDPGYPSARLAMMLEDAAPKVVVTGERLRSSLPAGAGHVITVEQALTAQAAAAPPAERSSADLAYVIFTSGSTGRPKGVMIEHRSICNLVQSDLDEFALSPDDRVVQGSSAAYDSSVEESYLAFAVGATLVVMDDDTARLGPDLVPWLRHEHISVFCPPPTLLRATGCEDPARELPALKLLYVGGEALPQDVADRWAVGCSLVNGYGPTECSVTCTRTRILAGVPVTIGTPVPDVHAWIVDESLSPVPDGEQGELVFGGAALARGYWNQPELTAQRFPLHPQLGRIYRTGDNAQRAPDGSLIYHGRLDAQVKLRGYRVELGAIESALVACDGVREAACNVQEDGGRQTLVAFIVAEAMVPTPTAAALQAALRITLPEYMVPARVEPIDALPTTIGGKLDRKSLPWIDGVGTVPHGAMPDDPVERAIADAVRHVLRIAHYPEVTADFFTALGGDSLSAAELITRLRDAAHTSALDVRDVYEARTIASLADRARERSARPLMTAATIMSEADADISVAGVTARQTLSLLRSLLVASAALWLAGFHVLPAVITRIGLVRAVFLAPPVALLVMFAWTPMAVALAVFSKRSLIGTYQAGRIRVWGPDYLRHWLVQQSVRGIPWWLIEGTEFQVMALRALGAKIGVRAHLHRGVTFFRGGWDLLDIGDDVTLSQDAALRIAELEHGHIVYAPVTLGHRVTVGIHAGVGGHCVLEPDAYVADNASIDAGTRVSAHERWDGLPAQYVGRAPDAPPLDTSRDLTPVGYALRVLAARVLLSAAFGVPLTLLTLLVVRTWHLRTARLLGTLLGGTFSVRLVVAAAALIACAVPFRLVLSALACRLMGRIPDGTFSRWSGMYVRAWLKPLLVDNASKWLYGALFWPYWLRLAGMRVGSDCEISSLIDTVPESVTIGHKNFFADGIYIGGPRVHRGTVTVAHTTFGSSTFLGNGVIVAAGQQLPDDLLLGICTVANPATMPSGTAWFGHPPFELPHREVIEYDPTFTFDPTPWRYAVRIFWELTRFVVPALPVVIVVAWFSVVAALTHLNLFLFLLFALPLATLGCGAAFATVVVLTKWSLLGKVQPAMHPLWSSWASRWDLMCLAWHICAGPIVSQLDGTLLLNALLRITGVHIGRRVVLGAGFAEDLPDPDMLTFEDYATIDCLFQAHTFEDRVLKMDRIAIRRGATVGSNSVLLYGADIGAQAEVAPHSVVMKHEHLHAGLRYAGFPTRPIGST
jgi:non-ribosomal peptide synthetase-like protein